MKERPILFSGAMVRAILEGRKTQTRRVIQPQPRGFSWRPQLTKIGWRAWADDAPEGTYWTPGRNGRCPYGERGDRLWVRETWGIGSRPCPDGGYDGVEYRADEAYLTDAPDLIACNRIDESKLPRDYDIDKWRGGWRRSIHMPRWASRLLLEVADVRGERVQETSAKDIIAEGAVLREHHCDAFAMIGANPKCPVSAFDSKAYPDLKSLWAAGWNSINAKPKPVYRSEGGQRVIDHYVSYPFENIRETRQHRGKPWQIVGNPWVWAVTFSAIDKEATA